MKRQEVIDELKAVERAANDTAERLADLIEDWTPAEDDGSSHYYQSVERFSDEADDLMTAVRLLIRDAERDAEWSDE